MHGNLLLGIPKRNYEPFITHNWGALTTQIKFLTQPEKAAYWEDKLIEALYNSSRCPIWMTEHYYKSAYMQSNITSIFHCLCIWLSIETHSAAYIVQASG